MTSSSPVAGTAHVALLYFQLFPNKCDYEGFIILEGTVTIHLLQVLLYALI